MASNTSFNMFGSVIDASIILSFSAAMLLESGESPACNHRNQDTKSQSSSQCRRIGSHVGNQLRCGVHRVKLESDERRTAD